MNALRLTNGVPKDLFQQRTGLAMNSLMDAIHQLQAEDLLINNPDRLQLTQRGLCF